MTRDLCQDLRYIKSVLHIPVFELSKVLGVPETQVSDILNNRDSGISIVDKINHLLSIAVEYKNLNIEGIDRLISEPKYNGKKLYEILNYKYTSNKDKFYLFSEEIY